MSDLNTLPAHQCSTAFNIVQQLHKSQFPYVQSSTFRLLSVCALKTVTIDRRKPAEVVPEHKGRAAVLFSGLIVAIFACEPIHAV